MNKVLVLLSVICLSITTVNAVEQAKPIQNQMAQKYIVMKEQRERAFEKRLELTEVQKLKAREIRKNGHEKLRPILEEIKYFK